MGMIYRENFSREYGLWLQTTICSIKLMKNKMFMQDVVKTKSIIKLIKGYR
jgi:hypothetical protein